MFIHIPLQTERMKKITIILLFLLGIISCETDESALNDYELFGRLQTGSGTWQIVQVETWNNTEENPVVNTTYPENDFYHFYIRTEMIGTVLVDYNAGDNYLNGNFSFSSRVEAETERVSFVTGGLAEGTVWTVVENKFNKQVWLRVYGDDNMQITLERCNCELPVPSGEFGG